ncbi:hypothetical protein EAY15_22635, partial [Vibrio anguillarum]|nr:hypothetical protein [Vibrio anguillarum]
KQQELSVALEEKAQRESQQAVKRIYQVLDQIVSRGEKGELSLLALTHLSDEINECFDYVLQEYDERSSLLELARQAIARECTRLEERQ